MNEELFNQYKPLAYKIASQFSRTYSEYSEDIESAAMIGLWQASEKETDGKFLSLAGATIKYSIINEVKKLRHVKGHNNKNRPGYHMDESNVRHISLDYAPDDNEAYTAKLNDEINSKLEPSVSPETAFYNEEIKQKLMKAIDELPDHQKNVIIALHFKDKNQRQLGRELGCSYQNIQTLQRRAFAKLKAELNNN